MNKAIDLFRLLITTMESEAGRIKIAELLLDLMRENQKLAEKVAEMNTSNNDLWKNVMIGLGGLLLAVGGAYAATREK